MRDNNFLGERREGRGESVASWHDSKSSHDWSGSSKNLFEILLPRQSVNCPPSEGVPFRVGEEKCGLSDNSSPDLTATPSKGGQSLLQAFCVCLLSLFFTSLSAQTELSVTPAYNNLDWTTFVEKCETELLVRFFFVEKEIPSEVKILVKEEATLLQVLNDNLNKKGVFASEDGKGNIFIQSGKSVTTSLPENYFKSKKDKSKSSEASGNDNRFLKTKKDYVGTTQVVGTQQKGLRERKSTVNGSVKDNQDGTSIIGATIYIEETGEGTASDENGFYSLILPKGKYTLTVQNLNHETIKFTLQVLSSGTLDLVMESQQFTLEGVVVTSEKNDVVRGSQMGFEKLSTKAIKEIPTVLGERDILKVALLLPGVQSVGEGSAGFNVRGSPADQNIFYIDNIPLYNTSHLLGFFSTFNSDGTQDFSIYKSNLPINFGGRLSSVFDITAKQGNKNEFSMRGGISPITGKLLVEGPIAKGKSSYMVSARSTYSDWMLRLVNDQDVKNSSAQFGDGMAKLNFDLGNNSQFRVFGYYSFDDLNFANKNRFAYQNIGISAGYRKVIKKKNTLDLDVVYYDYISRVEDNELEVAAFSQDNEVIHQEVKANYTIRPNNNHTIKVGANSVLYDLNRGDLAPLHSESFFTPQVLGRERGLESGVYIGDEWDVNPHLLVNGGLRYNIFNVLGGDEVFAYEEGVPRTQFSVIDTFSFNNYQVAKTYSGLDFRAAAKYQFDDRKSIKASFNRTHQYMFLLSNTISLSPTDKWKLIDSNIEPMRGDQLSAGYYTKLASKRYEASIEGYFKQVKNLVEYRDGADLIVAGVPEWEVLQGDLNAFGIETMLKKSSGKLSGWINYTFSQTRVHVDNENPEQRINFGNPYPSNYDKPHSVNVVATYSFTRRFSLSLNTVYATGRPITYPAGAYFQGDNRIVHYSERNEFRIPDYFRMDISAKLEGNLAKNKRIHGTWIFSIYNAIGRKNAYSVYFVSEPNRIQGYKLSVFGAPIISATYNFKLGHYE